MNCLNYQKDINMKNNVKEIITEAVLGFLNEVREIKPLSGKKTLSDSGTLFDENTKKKFLRAMGRQVNESMNLKS